MLRDEHIVKLNKCDEKFLFLTILFLPLSNKTSGEVWLSNIDLRNAYCQLMHFIIVGGETSGTYISIRTRSFEKIISTRLGFTLITILFTNCFIDDVLKASKGLLDKHTIIL